MNHDYASGQLLCIPVAARQAAGELLQKIRNPLRIRREQQRS